MNVDSATTSAFSAIASQRVGDAVSVSVPSKTLDIQTVGALALIDAIPAAPSTSLTVHLGTLINTKA
ncbi:MAG TPA: putative motility protein [Rhodocyclaceae bacterium]